MGSFGAILKNRVKWGHLGRFCKIALNGVIWGDFAKSRQMGSFGAIFQNRVKWGRFTRFSKIASNGVVLPDFKKSRQMGSFYPISKNRVKWGRFTRFSKMSLNSVFYRRFSKTMYNWVVLRGFSNLVKILLKFKFRKKFSKNRFFDIGAVNQHF